MIKEIYFFNSLLHNLLINTDIINFNNIYVKSSTPNVAVIRKDKKLVKAIVLDYLTLVETVHFINNTLL